MITVENWGNMPCSIFSIYKYFAPKVKSTLWNVLSVQGPEKSSKNTMMT